MSDIPYLRFCHTYVLRPCAVGFVKPGAQAGALLVS